MDGDGRGGAALSMRAVTGRPIKLLGVGEKMDALEDFHPRRLADRILGMGDIVSLVEKAAQAIDAEQAAKMAEKMRKGVFDLNDLSDQLAQIEKLGGLGGVMGMLPGVAKLKDQMASSHFDEKTIKRQRAIISSMTPMERRNPRRSQGVAQEAHRGGVGRDGRAGQPPAQAASPDGRHDEGDGRLGGQARPDGSARTNDGVRRRRGDADPGADRRDAEVCRRRAAGGRDSQRAAARRLQSAAAVSRSAGAGAPRPPGLGGGFPFGGKKK